MIRRKLEIVFEKNRNVRQLQFLKKGNSLQTADNHRKDSAPTKYFISPKLDLSHFKYQCICLTVPKFM
jgi:hypothetical protein